MATSATDNDGLRHPETSKFTYKRPQWPYEEWIHVPKAEEDDPANDVNDQSNDQTSKGNPGFMKVPVDLCDSESHSEAKEDLNDKQIPCNEVISKSCPAEEDKLMNCNAMTSDVSDLYTPDHWFDDNLFEDVTDDIPLSRLLAYMQPMVNYEDGEINKIAESMNKMMDDIAAKVSSSYDVFKDCWVIPVGSVVENTKIDKADEFDFAVVLPVFEEVDGPFDTLFKKDEEMLDDPILRAYAQDMLIEDGDLMNAVEHFQALMKQIWSFYLEDFAPEGWTVLETFCYEDEISIAGTFHLKRLSDSFAVDIDLCFLAAIHADVLRKSNLGIIQKEFILENCLDENGKVYAILSKDHDLNYAENIVRFAMSFKEREFLNRYGPNNGRINCYKLSKCIARIFLPKTRKRQECDLCLEAMVSSFCLKNIVLYLMHNYSSDDKWTNEQIGNRMIEVFQILNFSLKVNCQKVSAYFLPYVITVSSGFRYKPEKRAMVAEKNMILSGDEVQPVPCFLPPDLDKVIDFFGEDQISRRILENYKDFLSQSSWSSLEVIDRLVEMLGALRETCEESRKEIAENPGCTCFSVECQ